MARTLLTIVVALCLASSSVLAAPVCTQTQLNDGKNLADDPALKTACPVVLADGNLTSLDMTARMATANPCGLPSCATYLAQLNGKIADCENDGVNLRQLVSAFIEFCKSESGSAASSNSTSSAASDNSADKETVSLPDKVETTPSSAPSPSSAGGNTPAGSAAASSHLLASSAAAVAVAAITLLI